MAYTLFWGEIGERLILTKECSGGIVTNGGISGAKTGREKMGGRNGAESMDIHGVWASVMTGQREVAKRSVFFLKVQ